jgi:hypothetical protein
MITGVLSATGGVAGIIAGPGINVVTGGTPPGATSTISNTGVITLAATAPLVVGGTLQNRTLTVDVATVGTTGVVSVGSNISVSPTGVISVATGTTTTPGIVQLNNTTASLSTTQALTAAQGKALQDQINALVISSNLTFAGTLDTVTGNMITVTPAGVAAGFAASAPLPAAAALNNECFVIVEVPAASYTPPGGTATETHIGDWFLSDGTAWGFLNVGFDPPYATTTTPGVVELATDAETQAGTDATLAVTPASAAATYVPLADYTAKGDILAGSATASTPVALPVGADGYILYSCSTEATGLCWDAAPATPSATPTVRGILYGCSGGTNSAVGCNALLSLLAGTCNNALGCGALTNVTDGVSNIGIGFNAGCTLVDNCFNIAIGDLALGGATSSGVIADNVAIGFCSLSLTCIATGNVAVGASTLENNTIGECNTAIGRRALCDNTSGNENTAVGRSTLLSNTTGSGNSALGSVALNGNTSGNNNTAVGFCALNSLDGGNLNVALGASAGNDVSTENNVVLIGSCVTLPFAGNCQLAIGYASGQNWLTGNSTKAIKPGAGIIDCANTCGTAGQVLMSNGSNAVCWQTIPQACPFTYGTVYGKTNFANTLLGTLAGQAIQNLAGCAVTAIGYCAATALSTGTNASTALGSGALQSSTCSSYVTALGDRAMINAGNTCENVAVGTLALRSVTGNNNTAVGSLAGYDLVAGSNNIFIGRNAACANTSGNNNVVIGTEATTSSLTASCELAIGFAAGCNWLTGNNTKAIRPGAGIIDCAGSCGTACQVLISTGSNAITWVDSTAPSKLTSTKALTSGVPVDLLSWGSGVRMGALDIFATDGSSNLKWGNAYVGSSSGIGLSAITFQSVGMGTLSIVAGGGGETVIRFTPSVTLASVNFVFQYNAAFGNQPSVL